jgi:CHRD domain
MLKTIQISALPLLLAACAANPSTSAPVADSTVTFSTALSSASEVPAVTVSSSGSGSVSAVFDGMNLKVTGSFKGLTGVATLAHLHGPAGKTASAGVMFPLEFKNDATAGSGTLSGSVMLMGDQGAALKAGQLYINVHTAANAKGELRGQLELPKGSY